MEALALVVLIVATATPLLVIAYGLAARQQRRKCYDNILARLPRAAETAVRFPVRYASQQRFARWLKFFPWEDCGILEVDDGVVRYFSGMVDAGDTPLLFLPPGTELEWRGEDWFYGVNGGLSWVSVTQDDRKHYFTSETGTTILSSKSTTRELCEKLETALTGRAAD